MKGLYQKYVITKTSGKPLADGFYAIVLRIDGGQYLKACRTGVKAFADAVRDENPLLAKDLESAGNETEATAEESNALGEFEQKDKYSISTIVDVGNDAYKAGVKAERDRIREAVEEAELTVEETWEIYQANGGRGIAPRDQVNSVSEAQTRAILKALLPQEDCPDCKGTGRGRWCTGQHDSGYLLCPKCNGTGRAILKAMGVNDG